jgi:eukaryotic-like serine/threonine-protein kinase
MTWIPDNVVDRLRVALGSPDLSGTRYRAVRLLGRGGMAGVWLAEDTVLHRQVALKILDLTHGEENLGARLQQEAEILASLEHPGIVPVHDAGTLADGRLFCCMKWVQGGTLEQHVRALGSVAEGLRLILRVAEPLAFAHSRGVLHRDLKPGNIMIGAFGEVLVMDWGLAKRVHGPSGPEFTAPADPGRSNVGGTDPAGTGVVGTPGFMSPEQARGDAATVRSDIFSLGAVMAFTLANSASESRNSLPRQVKAICEKAMAADPALRYDSAEALAADISKYLEQKPVSAYHENVLERAARVMNRHATAIVLVLAYLLMRGLFILFAKR